MQINNASTEIVQAPLSQLREHPQNPNRGNVDRIIESIDENGFYGAVIAQKSTGYVLAGNHTLKAVKRLGQRTCPTIWVEVDDEKALKILVADNRVAELAHRDDKILAEVLGNLEESSPTSLDGTGYVHGELEALLQKLGKSELRNAKKFEPDTKLIAQWKCKRGQIWRVGKEHRIMCGDSLNLADVELLLDGKKMDAVVTDPPYEIDGAEIRRAIDYLADRAVVLTAQAQAFGILGGDWQHRIDFAWVRRRVRSAPIFHRPQFNHATVLMMGREGVTFGWERPNMSYHSVIEIEGNEYEQNFGQGKNPELFVELIKGFKMHQLWADPFLGSGSSLVACELQGKVLYGMELDPDHFAIALSRCAAFGLTPELIRDPEGEPDVERNEPEKTEEG